MFRPRVRVVGDAKRVTSVGLEREGEGEGEGEGEEVEAVPSEGLVVVFFLPALRVVTMMLMINYTT